MARALRLLLPFALIGIVSAWLVSTVPHTADWSIDAWPAVNALAQGHVSDYLSAKAMMGPFSTLLQTVPVALSSGGELGAYRWASFVCLLAAGFLGLYLADIARRRGASRLMQFVLAGLCLVNPLTVGALRAGHPEEILTAALAVAAVASAGEGKRGRTAVLLGLAVASKQWAVIAIFPVLMALPRSRLRVALSAGAIVFLLMLPGLVASPGSFFEVSGNAAATGRVVTPWSVWYPLATVETETHLIDGEKLVAHVHEAPPLVGSLSHPLIVLLAAAVPLGLALRRRSFGLAAGDAMALLALLALLRSVLDPVDNLYYHVPLLLALLGWDALSAPRSVPLRGLVGTGVALVFWHWSEDLVNVAAFNTAYLAALIIAGMAIAGALFRPGRRVYGLSAPSPHNRPQARVFGG